MPLLWFGLRPRFTEEHRAALDWLNKITDEKFRFFGLEVEAWQIGDSIPAPKFNIISQPNDLSKPLSRMVRKNLLMERQVKPSLYIIDIGKILQNI